MPTCWSQKRLDEDPLWGISGSMKIYTWPLGVGPYGKQSSLWKEWEEVHQLGKRGHSRQREPREKRLRGWKCLERSAYGKCDIHHRVVRSLVEGWRCSWKGQWSPHGQKPWMLLRNRTFSCEQRGSHDAFAARQWRNKNWIFTKNLQQPYRTCFRDRDIWMTGDEFGGFYSRR